jgi:hypothetical protein
VAHFGNAALHTRSRNVCDTGEERIVSDANAALALSHTYKTVTLPCAIF